MRSMRNYTRPYVAGVALVAALWTIVLFWQRPACRRR